jgi:Tfp pilus assembly protein PilF
VIHLNRTQKYNLPVFLLKKRVQLALLVIIPAILYSKSFWFDFSPLDDQWLIIQQEHLLKNWRYVFEVFSDAIQKMYYRPLLMISFALDYQLGGLNAFFYHVTNVLIHVAAVVLLYHFLLQLKTEKFTTFLLSLLFAVHPVFLHAVAWIPGRNDSLLCVFVLASLISLKSYVGTASKKYIFAHIVLFLCALFTKENAVLLPVVYFYLLYISGVRKKKLLSITALWILTVFVWLWARHGTTQHFPISLPASFLMLQKFMYSLAGNFGKMILPVSQALTAVPRTLSVPGGIAAAVIMILLFLRIPKVNRQTALLGFVLCFTLLFLPVWFGVLTPHGEQYEHRLYTSTAGIIIVLGKIRFKQQNLFHTTLLLIIGLFAFKTYHRMDLYKDSESYLTAAVKECPENYFLQAQLGTYWSNSGNCAAAIHHYSEAIKLNSGNAQLYLNRAQCYRQLGMFKEAQQDSDIAQQRIGRKYMEARGGNSSTVQDYAMLMAKELENLNKEIARDPANGELYVQRAKMYFDRRMGNEALADLKKACELEPENEDFRKYYEELNRSFPHK